jgi:WD40 repeat protein
LGTPSTDESSSRIAIDETIAAEDAAARPVVTVATAAPPDAVSPTSELPEVSPKRYAVGDEIGRGGIGRVRAARDRTLDREVALKELAGANTSARRRFVREAMLTARLQHPSIVPVYDAGVWPDGAPFYAMKLVGGRPLSEVVAAADTLDARLALVPSVLAVADAIAYAHRRRIIHRDLKPQNVLVGEFGETIVIDWGLAKDLAGRSDSDGDGDDDDATIDDRRANGSSDRTVAGAVLGTPAYMAPEQAAGRDVDERADVYALGGLLYFVLTRRAPHEGRTADEVFAAATAGIVAPLAEVVPGVPSDLAAIVGKAMAVDPAARYASGRELADDLRRFTTGKLVDAHRYRVGERVRRWLRRYRAIAITAAIAFVVLATYGVWSIDRILHQRDTAAERANRAVVAKAQQASDPAEGQAWLRQLDPEGGHWEDAREVAAHALSEPTPKSILHDIPRGAPIAPTESRRFLVAWHDASVWVADLSTGTTRTLATSANLDGLETCADDRAKAWFSRGGARWDVEIDLAKGSVQEIELSKRVDAGTERDPTPTCPRNELVERNAFPAAGLYWSAPGIGSYARPLNRGDYVRHRLTADRKHVVALGQFDDIGDWQEPDKAKPTSIAWWDEHLGKAHEVAAVVYGRDDVLLSADGVIGGALHDGTLMAWNVSTGIKRAIAVPDATLAAIAPDGSWFAVARKTTIDLLAPDGALVDRLQGLAALEPRGSRLVVSPGGRWLVAVTYGAWDGAVVWDLRGGRRPRRLYARLIAGVVFGPRDEIITIGKYDEVRIWEPEEATVPFSARARTVALSPNGRWVVAANDTTIERIDLETKDRERRDLVNSIEAGELAISDRGDVGLCLPAGVVMWSRDGAPSVIGRHHVDCANPDGRVDTEPDHCRIAIVGDTTITADECATVEWRRGKRGARYDATLQPVEAITANDSLIVVGATLIDRRTGAVHPLQTPLPILDRVLIAPDSSRIAVGHSRDPTVVVWNVGDSTSHRIPLGAPFSDAAIAPDSRSLVTSGPAGTIERIDLSTGTVSNLGIGPEPGGFVGPQRIVRVSAGTVLFWDLGRSRSRTSHIINTEWLDGEPRETKAKAIDTSPAYAWRALDRRFVLATAHGALTIRDDLPTDVSLIDHLGHFAIDPNTDAVTFIP